MRDLRPLLFLMLYSVRPSTAKDRFSARKISQTPTSSVDTQRPRYAIYI